MPSNKKIEVTIDDLDPWERRPGENGVWFDRFTKFRLLGPNRTIREVWRFERAKNAEIKVPAIPLGMYKDWEAIADLWHWRERAEAWDEYLHSMQEAEAYETLNQGLSLAHKRVDKLKAMAAKLENFLLTSKGKISPFLMEQYRGLLDDIAKELGQRNKEVRLTGVGGGPIVIQTEWGRGASATLAWEKEDQKLLETQVTEITEGSGQDGASTDI